jgi:hypothetical protein
VAKELRNLEEAVRRISLVQRTLMLTEYPGKDVVER